MKNNSCLYANSILISSILFLLSIQASPSPGEETAAPSTGRVVGPSGRTVMYESHVARNALKASRRINGSTIAITQAGTIINFNVSSGRVVRERGGDVEATCLGIGEEGVAIVGLADGRICRLNVDTLDLVELAEVTGTPVWVGWNSAHGGEAGYVVLTASTRPGELFGQLLDLPYVRIHDLATGWTAERPGEVTACLLDREGCLWIGLREIRDHGSVVRSDLARKAWATIAAPPLQDQDDEDEGHDQRFFWTSVRGFLARPDGAIWAYGGTAVHGDRAGRIARIDGEDGFAESLYLGGPRENECHLPPRDQPIAPITIMLAENEGRGLLVLSHADVFRTDGGLKTWKRTASLTGLHGRRGEIVVGDGDSLVTAIHPPDREGAPYTLATAFNGYILWDGLRTTPRSLVGQLGLASVGRVENSTEGVLGFEVDLGLPPQALRDGVWEIATPLSELVEPTGQDDPQLDHERHLGVALCVLVGPHGEVHSLSNEAFSSTTSTILWRDGKPRRLGSESTSLFLHSSFITGDGELWNVSMRHLKRFEEGRWRDVKELPNSANWIGVDCLNADAPWILLKRNKDEGTLWMLDPGGDDREPELTSIDVGEGDRPLRFRVGIAQPEGTLLLASDAGFHEYNVAAKRLVDSQLPQPPGAINALTRDGSGRLWAGTDTGLYLLDAEADSWESFEYVPWLHRNPVESLKPNPRRADGVIVALGRRGVLFLEATGQP